MWEVVRVKEQTECPEKGLQGRAEWEQHYSADSLPLSPRLPPAHITPPSLTRETFPGAWVPPAPSGAFAQLEHQQIQNLCKIMDILL